MPPKPKRPRLVTDVERARVRELHAQGLSRNAIAKELGRPWSTITGIAKTLGLSFDRAATKQAVEARQVDNKARRAELSARLLTIAVQQLDRVNEPGLVYAFGGKDNDYNEHTLDRPPPADVRNLMTAAAIAIDKHAVLEKLDTDNGSAGARSMLLSLAESLNVAAGLATDAEG